MMRDRSKAAVRPSLVVCCVVGLTLTSCSRTRPAATAPHESEAIATARVLDQQGVLAFETGRYRDALVYFDAALAHGGPPSERWNAARCHLRLDEPDRAEDELVAYLAMAGLAPDDRRDGAAALDGLRRRPSTLTVVSTPSGLPVRVDGRRVGASPVSVSVSAGDHVVVVDREPGGRDARRVSARLGRALLVEAKP